MRAVDSWEKAEIPKSATFGVRAESRTTCEHANVSGNAPSAHDGGARAAPPTRVVGLQVAVDDARRLRVEDCGHTRGRILIRKKSK